MIENIPVVLDFKLDIPVGRARIEDGKLLIEVPGEVIVREIESLVRLDHVIALSLGIQYKAVEPNRS